MPITFALAEAAARLPLHHHDPFDRILVAQAIQDGWLLVTADGRLRAYGAPIVDPARRATAA